MDEPACFKRNSTVPFDVGEDEPGYMPEGAVVCPTCKGRGFLDSCFDCGNRGWVPEV